MKSYQQVCTSEFMDLFPSQLMECCVNALVTSFKETILAECPGMIKRNETDSEYEILLKSSKTYDHFRDLF